MRSRTRCWRRSPLKSGPPRKARLTELAVKKLKPAATARLIWDTKQPSGAKSWVVLYNRHGRTRWLTLGDANIIGLASARTMAQEAMLAVAKGGDPAADKKAERGAGSFIKLADRYLDHAKRHNKSWKQGRALVERFAIPRWSKLRASSITRGDVKQMMSKIEAPIVANQA